MFYCIIIFNSYNNKHIDLIMRNNSMALWFIIVKSNLFIGAETINATNFCKENKIKKNTELNSVNSLRVFTKFLPYSNNLHKSVHISSIICHSLGTNCTDYHFFKNIDNFLQKSSTTKQQFKMPSKTLDCGVQELHVYNSMLPESIKPEYLAEMFHVAT